MREIHFRGKRVDNNEWVYGYFIMEYGKYAFILEHSAARLKIEVDPETVGEFTGLCDKDGKPIFEGDVTKRNNGKFYRIEWMNSDTRFVCQNISDEKDCYYLLDYFAKRDEIVGTIHDK